MVKKEELELGLHDMSLKLVLRFQVVPGHVGDCLLALGSDNNHLQPPNLAGEPTKSAELNDRMAEVVRGTSARASCSM